jgi:2-polyprenyl-3-methyl-5-hydroxy-6-metoxy-1,4-benzoquinol methylase
VRGVTRAIVQASSRSWGGAADESVAPFEGEAQFVRTVRFLSGKGLGSVVVAAPEFDRDGVLGTLLAHSRLSHIPVLYAHDASPLLRCLAACSDLGDNDHVLRTNGANFTIPHLLLDRACALLESERPDLIKLPDDYPGPYQFEIYRLGALRAAATSLPASSPFNIHPRFLVAGRGKSTFVVSALFDEIRADLAATRDIRKSMDKPDFLEVDNAASIAVGDQLSFHYTLALEYMRRSGAVLDIGCGHGYGSLRLATAGFQVTGADLNPERIASARARLAHEALGFRVLNGCDLKLEDASCDYVTSFETLEHVDDPAQFLRELHRVLKPGGLLFLSTPQNCFGAIPTTPAHIVEFSFAQLHGLVSQSFDVVEFIALKAGTIFFRGDAVGANSFVVARARKELIRES